MVAVESAQLIAGKGITGDRFYGNRIKHTRLNLTLIEAETIDSFNLDYGEAVEPRATRRNLITRHIRLNEWVGRSFFIGNVLCLGIELCEPCTVMAREFLPCRLSADAIIQAFANKGGLRAEILTGGIIRLGDVLTLKNEM